MPDRELDWLSKQAAVYKNIVEIGSFMGRSTRALAESTRGTVTAVDTWAGSDEDEHRKLLEGKDENWLFREFLRNMSGLDNLNILRTSSLEAANGLPADEMFDFIFIDAAHDYDSVKADILAWGPRLLEGGTLAGHDFHSGAPGVMKAVNELLGGYKLYESIWYVGG